MAGTVGLHQLVGAVAGAIVDAQAAVERRYLDLVSRYFDSDGRAISFDIKLPDPSRASAEGAFIQLGVPLLSLVESSLLAITEMRIDLDVEIGEIAEAAPPLNALGAPSGAPRSVPRMTLAGDPAAASDEMPAGASAAAAMAHPVKELTVGLNGRAGGASPTAKLSILVEARPQSEGLMRLLTQLNTVV